MVFAETIIKDSSKNIKKLYNDNSVINKTERPMKICEKLVKYNLLITLLSCIYKYTLSTNSNAVSTLVLMMHNFEVKCIRIS
jgi:hypothetical protein